MPFGQIVSFFYAKKAITCLLYTSIGTREIIAWAKATVLLNGNMRAAADYTLLPSVGEDPDDVAAVRSLSLIHI